MDDNISILDQILDNQKAEEVNKLDAVEFVNNLFSELSQRERDILIRRYGLHSGEKETLESIGSAHDLTRERIRQIETTSVRKLQSLENLDNYISTLKKVIYQLLEEHGGLMEREYLSDLLVGFSVGGFKTRQEEELVHKNYLNFLITKLLYSEFEEFSGSRHFKPSYKLKYQSVDHLEEVAAELTKELEKIKRVHATEEIIDLIKQLEAYRKHEDRLATGGSIDVSRVLRDEFLKDKPHVVNQHKALFSILKASRKIEQNKFGHWGAHKWREVKPKTINDKIYLILKNRGKPMHFTEIADEINRIGFDNKKANAATAHNELILDSKYVLVGRGLYGLKEWGYKQGTVADVIEEILSQSDEPLSRDAIIERVLDRRIVKKATIVLALMDKSRFSRVNGKYVNNKSQAGQA